MATSDRPSNSGARTAGGGSFTGIARRRQTTPRVAVFDKIARWTITIGGIATIAAVITVGLFLVWVVLPLLRSGHLEEVAAIATPSADAPIVLQEDPYRRLGLALAMNGEAVAFATADGRIVARQRVFDPAEVSAAVPHGGHVLLGRRDGAIQFVTIGFSSDIQNGAPSGVAADLAAGSVVMQADGVLVERTPEGQFRRQELAVHKESPTALGATEVRNLAYVEPPGGTVLAAFTTDGLLHIKTRSVRHDLLEDKDIVELDGASVPLREIAPGIGDTPPDHVFLTGIGDDVLLLWNDGRLLRLDTRDIRAPRQVENLDVLPDDRTVRSACLLTGQTTLLVGDDHGRVTAWFRANAAPGVDVGTGDGRHLVEAHVYEPLTPSPVVALNASERSRLFAVAQADGSVAVWNATSERRVAEARADGEPLRAVALSTKEDGLLAAGPKRLHRWDLHPGNPEATLATAFRPVWYEGAPGPEHVWQSTGGSDDFEPKLGLWPLIYGTLKATFYCLLFGVPLALLAAIYTSEFLSPRWRARIKPTIELMASLPSVVLGFLAALVFAPIVADHLVAVLLAILMVPAVFAAMAQIWQVLPPWLRPAGERWRVPAAALAVPAGVMLAALVAPLAERLLFGGDIKDWLAVATRSPDAADRGSAFGGWLLLLLPVGALLAALVVGRLKHSTGLRRFSLGAGLTVVAAVALGALLTGLGWDLRGNLLGTFDQRNSLVVGIAMGFAVVPIVYTIAEDALSAVPEHLRAASLGAGATQWQTAVRVVLPTALSGVFSAIMIGLGRAVGETMIVVMAVGGTPIMDMNIFNGFRTLSANIATELPEAVRNSTHYRMLYLAALCLFAMTFVLNTLAEVVRQRFRKRAFQL